MCAFVKNRSIRWGFAGLVMVLAASPVMGQATQRRALAPLILRRPVAPKPAEPAADKADTAENTSADEDATVNTTQPSSQPSSRPASQPAGPAAGIFSPQERDRLKLTYNALSEPEKAEMRAVYKDMGVDITTALGIKAPVAAKSTKTLPDAVRALDFTRKPEEVLAARSKLGFSASIMPAMENAEAVAAWLHMNVMAGEWKVFTDFLPLLPADDAIAIYSHILRSTNKGTQNLLPEEILALGDASPDELVDWQLDVLAQMLKSSAESYGKELFLGKLKAGTRLFGKQDEASRKRTGQLLVKAGLLREAYEYLPTLEDARKLNDAQLMLAHAMYYLDLVASGGASEQSKESLNKAWDLMCEISLMPSADAALRKDAAKRAIDLLTRVPPSRGTEWLTKAFADPSLGPAALEIVALQAISLRDKKVDAARRAESISTMKAAVDTMLTQPGVEVQTLRVPLRMLTTALADAVDDVVKEKGGIRGVAAETQLLFKAAPDERWLAAIEPSVAIRGYHAAMAIATIADQTDIALDVLKNAAKRFPGNAPDLADEFLTLWIKRLQPSGNPADDENSYFFYARQRVPAAPLTRGRQRRNLDRLERLVELLSDLGVKARQLPSVTTAFKACYARTEVFDRDQIVRVFGPFNELPAATAAALAGSMRSGLGGDWRNRQVAQAYGVVRSKAEIEKLIDVGYTLAIDLADRAVAMEPNSWRHAVLKAGLNYDRVQYNKSQKKEDFATFNEYRRQAFSAFEQAALQYADLVTKGLEQDNAGVYLAWFSALLDVGQPVDTSSDNAESQAAAAAEQIDRIAKAMKALPPDALDRHIGAFAREVVESLANAPPEQKPTIVRSAVRIVGDHPAGTPLRDLYELYEDLLKNEIKLRIVLDGADRVSTKQTFGAVLTLRFTNSVDRETGGFDKYLYQDTYERIGNQYRMINYQNLLRKGVETALAESFNVESIGFFEPLTPSREVKEDGQLGWQEKPMAYMVLKAKDPSVDRLPQLTFDMHFNDTSGPVTLPIVSNSPPINASADALVPRPLKNLQVNQTLDLRRLISGTEDKAVTLEISAKADGVVPDIRDVLDGLDTALPGYKIADNGIETRPLNVVQTEDGDTRRSYYRMGATDEKKTYVQADENGIFRLSTERSWLVTFKPTGAAVGGAFVLPKLKNGLTGSVTSRHYADMDVVQVDGPTVAVTPHWSRTTKTTAIALGAVVVIFIAWRWMRRRAPLEVAEGGLSLPGRITPLSTIAALQRISRQLATLTPEQRTSLAADIESVQRAHFGPNGSTRPDESTMRALLERWAMAR